MIFILSFESRLQWKQNDVSYELYQNVENKLLKYQNILKSLQFFDLISMLMTSHNPYIWFFLPFSFSTEIL